MENIYNSWSGHQKFCHGRSAIICGFEPVRLDTWSYNGIRRPMILEMPRKHGLWRMIFMINALENSLL